LLRRAAQLRLPLVAESARWGDSNAEGRGRRRGYRSNEPPLTRDNWEEELNRVLNDYIPIRSGIVFEQLWKVGLYPSFHPPTLSQFGGLVGEGYELQLDTEEGEIFYTLDGSDPRQLGGTASDLAVRYSGSIFVRNSVELKSRVLRAGTWSALSVAKFEVQSK
jgi:hypothetical protein